jgi:hypothetical protein
MSGTTPGPGLARQRVLRTVFRVVGVVAAAGALVLVVSGALGFVTAMDSPSMDGGTGPMLEFIVGALLGLVALLCLSAGFGGAAARYAAGELAPVVEDTLASLEEGEPAATCLSCGAEHAGDAKFCPSCGTALG